MSRIFKVIVTCGTSATKYWCSLDDSIGWPEEVVNIEMPLNHWTQAQITRQNISVRQAGISIHRNSCIKHLPNSDVQSIPKTMPMHEHLDIFYKHKASSNTGWIASNQKEKTKQSKKILTIPDLDLCKWPWNTPFKQLKNLFLKNHPLRYSRTNLYIPIVPLYPHISVKLRAWDRESENTPKSTSLKYQRPY